MSTHAPTMPPLFAVPQADPLVMLNRCMQERRQPIGSNGTASLAGRGELQAGQVPLAVSSLTPAARKLSEVRMEDVIAAPDLCALEPDVLRRAALETLIDGVWVLTIDGTIVYRNAAAAAMENLHWQRAGRIGTMRELVMSPDKLSQLLRLSHAFSEYHLMSDELGQQQAHSIGLEMQVLYDGSGKASGISLHARDLSREWGREQFLQDRHIELEQAYARLKETQMQLLQSEKMASIGQLAAGVAHEINNPIGYVHSNLGTLQNYSRGLLLLLEAYDRLSAALPEEARHLIAPIDELKSRFDYPFLQQDLPQLVEESREGIERVKKIVLDLRDFSHSGDLENEEWVATDVHRGLESTLNIVWNEIKYKAEVRRDFGELPPIQCVPSQLNQVFLNLLVNASQAIGTHGEIAIVTRCLEEEVCISISDTGSGMSPEQLQRIFDPFYTTKPVGQGTGLGLSLSYGIVQKHGGRIEVESAEGVGSTFNVFLPIQRVAP